MPTLFNPNKKKGVFMVPSGGTKSPTPPPPSFSNTKSLAFDGVDDYVDTGTSALNGASALTVSVWFNTSYDTWQYMLGDNSIRIFLKQNSNRVDFTFNGSVDYRTTNFNITLGTWNNLVIVFDGSLIQADRLKLYLNTSLLTNNLSGTSDTTFVASNNFMLGRAGSSSSSEWNGNLDEVGIWNVALGSTAITELYTNGPIELDTDTGNYTSASDLQAWYRMGDNSTYQTPQILMPSNENKDKVSNWSFEFDGVNDSIGIGTTSLGITSAISVSAWVKTTDTSFVFRSIFAEDTSSGTNRNWNLLLNSSNKIGFIFFNTDGSTNYLVRTTALEVQDGNWHHILATYDGTANADGIKLYIDGNLESATAGSTGIRSTASVEPYIGSLTNGNAWRWNGSIDEVSVFDAVKVVADVSDGTQPINLTGKANLVAYWKLGEEATFSTNWTVPDSSANSNDGTSANMTIEDRIGNAPNSNNNTVSYNMTESDIETETP